MPPGLVGDPRSSSEAHSAGRDGNFLKKSATITVNPVLLEPL
jgi:hypothetical protein